MVRWNAVLWAASLLLHGGVLLVLVRRGLVRRVPVFTLLMGFYLVRTAGLFLLAHRPRTPGSVLVLSSLAVVDTVLQMAVAWALFSLGTARAMPLLRRVAVFAVLVMVAGGLTVLCATHVRVNPRAPIDRGILLPSLLFGLVFLVGRGRPSAVLQRRLRDGFAVYAGASVVCQIGRAMAGARRDVFAFDAWSYGAAAVYLAVLLFWIAALPAVSMESAPATMAENG